MKYIIGLAIYTLILMYFLEANITIAIIMLVMTLFYGIATS